MKQAKWLFTVLIVVIVVTLCFGCKSVTQVDGSITTGMPLGPTELVRHSNRDAGISLKIPAGWEYEIQDEQGTDSFCIAFWPAGQKKGKIAVCYDAAFGVCGTGLTQRTVTIGNYAARQGTYDGQKMFDFISFIDTYCDYVIINKGADFWWDTQGGTAMQILNTLALGNETT